MENTTTAYDDLVDELHKALALARRAEERMLACRPGSAEGARFYKLLRATEARAAEARKAVRSHPDAPPQG